MVIKDKVNKSLEILKAYIEKEKFKGWDPYDGLTSKLVRITPFYYFKIGRLAWIQFFKRSPRNFRKLFLIPKMYNPKALGLLLSGYCNLYKKEPKEEYLDTINFLKDRLFELRTPGFSGDCWGYSFPWQSRVFFQKTYSPTIIPTAFIGNALMDAYDVTGDQKILESAISTSEFIKKDLNRTPGKDDTFIFSYSPFDNTQVFNASLLAVRHLIRVYSYTKDEELLKLSKQAVQFVCDQQKEDGSWIYGLADIQTWIDSFHTGYNLEAIFDYQRFSGDNSFNDHIEKGLDYYVNTFFTKEGRSIYYHDKEWPVDAHAPTQLMVTLAKMNKQEEYKDLLDRVINWTIDNMQHDDGYFYYRMNEDGVNKIPYMRWVQAWMFYALSYYQEK